MENAFDGLITRVRKAKETIGLKVSQIETPQTDVQEDRKTKETPTLDCPSTAGQPQNVGQSHSANTRLRRAEGEEEVLK